MKMNIIIAEQIIGRALMNDMQIDPQVSFLSASNQSFKSHPEVVDTIRPNILVLAIDIDSFDLRVGAEAFRAAYSGLDKALALSGIVDSKPFLYGRTVAELYRDINSKICNAVYAAEDSGGVNGPVSIFLSQLPSGMYLTIFLDTIINIANGKTIRGKLNEVIPQVKIERLNVTGDDRIEACTKLVGATFSADEIILIRDTVVEKSNLNGMPVNGLKMIVRVFYSEYLQKAHVFGSSLPRITRLSLLSTENSQGALMSEEVVRSYLSLLNEYISRGGHKIKVTIYGQFFAFMRISIKYSLRGEKVKLESSPAPTVVRTRNVFYPPASFLYTPASMGGMGVYQKSLVFYGTDKSVFLMNEYLSNPTNALSIKVLSRTSWTKSYKSQTSRKDWIADMPELSKSVGVLTDKIPLNVRQTAEQARFRLSKKDSDTATRIRSLSPAHSLYAMANSALTNEKKMAKYVTRLKSTLALSPYDTPFSLENSTFFWMEGLTITYSDEFFRCPPIVKNAVAGLDLGIEALIRLLGPGTIATRKENNAMRTMNKAVSGDFVSTELTVAGLSDIITSMKAFPTIEVLYDLLLAIGHSHSSANIVSKELSKLRINALKLDSSQSWGFSDVTMGYISTANVLFLANQPDGSSPFVTLDVHPVQTPETINMIVSSGMTCFLNQPCFTQYIYTDRENIYYKKVTVSVTSPDWARIFMKRMKFVRGRKEKDRHDMSI